MFNYQQYGLIEELPSGRNWVQDALSQPAPIHRQKRTAATFRGDDGIEGKYNFFRNSGWVVQPWQPPHRRPERGAAILRGDDGIEGKFNFFRNAGWVIQPPQPPHRRPERAGAIMAGEQGVEAKFVPPAVTVKWGWESAPSVYKHPVLGRGNAAAGKSQFAAPGVWVNIGWEIQPPQPPHRKPERAGAVMVGDAGIEAKFIPPVAIAPTWGFDQPITAIKRNIRMLADHDDGIQSPYRVWRNAGWEVQPPQPPHRRPERDGAIQIGEQGIEAEFSVLWRGWEPVLATYKRPALGRGIAAAGKSQFLSPGIWVNDGWEIPPPIFRSGSAQIPARRGAARLRTEFSYSIRPPILAGWEFQPAQPPHSRQARGGAIMVGDAGIEAKFIFVPSPTSSWGFDQAPVQPRYSVANRGAIRQRISFGFPLVPWKNTGWEVQPVQPRHLRIETRYGAIAKGDDGTAAQFSLFHGFGWPVQPPQPPHPARERRMGGLAKGDEGIGSPQPASPLSLVDGWAVQPFQPRHPRPELRFAATAKGDEGIVAGFNFFRPSGWVIQLPQPPHPRQARAAAVMVGDSGIEAPFINVVAPLQFLRWYPDPWMSPHRRTASYAAIMRGSDGIEGPYVPVVPPIVALGRTGLPIYPLPLDATVTTLVGYPAPVFGAHPETQIAINQGATLMMTVESFPQGAIQLLFTRPDGSQFYVSQSPFLYAADIFDRPFVIYTTAYGDLNQPGWWIVQVLGNFDPPGTLVYSFWVFEPNRITQ